jgi:hypothetical protein
MSVRRGPTERDRSEGTRRSRAQPRAQALGYLGLYQVTRRRRNVCPQADALDLDLPLLSDIDQHYLAVFEGRHPQHTLILNRHTITGFSTEAVDLDDARRRH